MLAPTPPTDLNQMRRRDPDRFLTALFAPADRRAALLTLYAFNHELTRAREVTSEPTLALIRLHWWREVVQGTPKRHEIATPLSDAIAQGLFVPAELLALVEAREREVEGDFATLADWRAWLLAGAGGLAVAAARLLGAVDPGSFRAAGAVYGAAGVLRATGALATQGRCLLPLDLLDRHGLVPEAVIGDPASAAPVAASLAQQALGLWSRSAVTRATVAAALPGVLGRRDLRRWPRVAHPRRFGDRLAVTIRGLTGLL